MAVTVKSQAPVVEGDALSKIQAVIGDNLTILLFGPTGSGKTAQLGEVAEWKYVNEKKYTRIYTADRGGWETIRPYVELGIIKIVPLFGEPWAFIDHAIKGDKLNDKGEWVPGKDPEIGIYAFEGMTSFCDSVMSWMAEASGKGVNIGGGGSFNFKVKDGKDTISIGSNNMAHYGVAQQQIYEKSVQSQMLPGTVIWTAGDKRGEDDAAGGVIGPQTAGKAQSPEVARWFKYTFRLAQDVQPGMPVKHLMYLDRHIEMAGKTLAQGIANSRVPMAGGDEVKIPDVIEPASLVTVLELLKQRQVAAKDAIRIRLGL